MKKMKRKVRGDVRPHTTEDEVRIDIVIKSVCLLPR